MSGMEITSKKAETAAKEITSKETDLVAKDVGLRELCADSAATAAKSGFVGQSLPEFVAFVHSELSEALEEHRDHRKPGETWYSLKSARMEAAAREELGLGPDDPLPRGVNVSVPVKKGTPGAKPEGIPSEIADTVIRCAHFCGANGIDLAAAVLEKAAYNATRSFRHGGRRL
jgi:hypothetical protein